MAQLSLSRAWDETRAIFARDGGLLIVVALAMLVLPETVVGLITPGGMTMTLLGRCVWLVGALIGLVGQIALVRLALGPSTTVGQAIGHGARRFLPTVGALLILFACLAIIVVPLMMVLIFAGVMAVPVQGQQPPPSFTFFALLFALVSLALSVKFMMAVPVSTAEQVSPLDIIKRSWRLTNGNYWRLLGFLALLLVAAVFLLTAAQFIGGIAAQLIAGRITPFSLGALILALLQALASATVTALFAVMLARIYLQLTGATTAQASVPSSGT